ncbi:MAG: leucine-rich repeat protein [Coriobacteriia bacterium]|nr:leucine-rich repeat protein [Coriobacteriia bacterium]
MLGRRWKSITTVVLAVAMLVAPVQVARADSSGGFEYTITAGTATITGYTGSGGAVTIPSTLGGNPVTTIGFEAFKNQAVITSVAIPNSVTRVNGSAFQNCDGLTSVVIPNSVTYFGDSAFAGCSNLASAVLSSNAKEIGQSAFEGCKKLTSVTIPYGVELIGAGCFQFCGALTSVTLPNSVSRIGFQAFAFCKNLTSANIPSSVTSLKQGVFADCYSLTSMTVPGSVTYMEPGLFIGCRGLKSVTIGEGVTEIPCGMFESCPSLTDVSIPNSVTEVGSFAFFECTSLKRIALPESAAIIGTPSSSIDYGGRVFEGCTSLTDVTLPSSVTNMYSTGMFKGCTSLESVILPEGTNNCNKETFAGCTSLTDVTIPDSLTVFGEDTFNGCTALKNITIPDSVQWWGDRVFQDCTSLESVVIPMGVKTLGSDAFAGCTSLTSVAVPSSVTIIGYRVFKGCSKLVSAYFSGNSPTLTLPGSGTTVFDGCPTSFKVYFESTATGWPTPPATWYGYNTAYFQNTDPYLSVIGSRPVSVRSPVTFTASAYDNDGDTRTYTLASGAPVGAKMNPTTGVFTWTPTKAQAGRVYDIKVKVTDGRGGVDYDTPRFTVAPFVPTTIAIEGGNRYATAVAASKKAFPSGGSNYVVIATGENWPDALGGAALAGALDCPILLTKKASLPAETRAEIIRLGATKAIVLGGTGAVSSMVDGQIRAIAGVSVERIDGSSRYDTADQVAERTIDEQGIAYDGTAFIATGKKFPDALGASPLAAATGSPIYLSNPAKGDNAALIATMKAKGVNAALVLGGKSAVASSIETKARATLGQVTRLAGDDRYKTAVAIATYGVNSAGLSWDKLAIATGTNFPDALSGGALQGKSGSVMLLTPGAALNGSVRAALVANTATVYEVRFLGGLSAVSQPVRTDVTASLK